MKAALRHALSWFLLGSGAAGCGPGLAEKMADQARQRERLERSAVQLFAPEQVQVRAGQVADISLGLQIGQGFYVPAPERSDDIAGLRLLPPRSSFAQVTHVTLPPDPKLVELPGHSQPVLCYDGERTIGVRLDVHRSTTAGRRLLTFEIVYQLCSVHGCSVPQRLSARTWLEVQPAPSGGGPSDLAP